MHTLQSQHIRLFFIDQLCFITDNLAKKTRKKLAFHSIIRDITRRLPQNKVPRRYLSILASLSMCMLILLILATFSLIVIKDLRCGIFWFYGYVPIKPNLLRDILTFLCVFIYISQQILFPCVFIILFFLLNVKLTMKIEKMKIALSENIFFRFSLSKQSCMHKKIIYEIRKYDELFSFPVFLILGK